MYLSKKEHLLSRAICISAFTNLGIQVMNALVRMLINRHSEDIDMMNRTVWYSQIFAMILMILIIFAVFRHTLKKVRRYQELISEEDDLDMAKLQREFNPEGISTIPLSSIENLVQIWMAILVWCEIIYMITGMEYKSFVKTLLEVLPADSPDYGAIVGSLYNSTHGFKYIGMFTALILGILITGIFIRDRWLQAIAAALSVLYLLAFAMFQASTLATSIRSVSLVWTSVIFHLLETFGLLVLSIYLARKYRGL